MVHPLVEEDAPCRFERATSSTFASCLGGAGSDISTKLAKVLSKFNVLEAEMFEMGMELGTP
jgi:hypothetical protein